MGSAPRVHAVPVLFSRLVRQPIISLTPHAGNGSKNMSAKPDLTDRQRAMLRSLVAGAAERARAEEDAAAEHQSRVEAAESLFDEESQELVARFAVEKDGAAHEQAETRESAIARHKAELVSARTEFGKERHGLREEYGAGRSRARNAFQEASWTASALLEATKTEADAELKEQLARVAEKKTKLNAMREEARLLLRGWKQPEAYLDWAEQDGDGDASGLTKGNLPRCLADAQRLLGDLNDLSLPNYLKRRRLTTILVLLWLALIVPAGWLTLRVLGQPFDWAALLTAGAGVGLVAAGILLLVAYLLFSRLANAAVRRVAQPLGVCFQASEGRIRHLTTHLNARCEKQQRTAQVRHDRTLRRAKKRFRQERAAVALRRREAFPAVKALYLARRTGAVRRRAEELQAADRRYTERIGAADERFAAEQSRLKRRLEQIRVGARGDYERSIAALASAWRGVLDHVGVVTDAVEEELSSFFPAWDSGAWQEWTPPMELPPALWFGTAYLSREHVPHAVPADQRLRSLVPPDLALPALTKFPSGASIQLRASGAGKAKAIAAIQGVMFRLLTGVPPGRVRFTIVDAVGLGQHFAGFMQLADYEPTLVGGRILTEPGQIDQRLAELTAHMENVIQKYLRDRFATLAEYNVFAAEVAEPYNVLVVANFPAGFTDEAARRLIRICSSGPRCGVHILLSTDDDLEPPHGFAYGELRTAVRLVWDQNQFRWEDDDFSCYPLELEASPPAEVASLLLERVGQAAKAARRVELPFDYIAPSPNEWWQGDSGPGLAVALGRAAAGGRQLLKLGHGTSQHVVIAGKTGSGKSTLLHALITNLALNYGPDQVELYLIDFKKGVEFKTYAARGLPHARVVAIESEREFGLSVLQRLDAELRHRGEIFRGAGVQDLPAYRRLGRAMPRVLLIVDEFQEFFVEDDRIAQDAASLLDRLVRQGRAFGLHVLLGSQTLGGAFSLARSTIDQMAVRIALQCSESDAQLILSMENSAAKLLTRPGEAIYNDANGLEEGNHLFQIVWLDETRRESYLNKLHERANGRDIKPPVVFEGNAPADVRRNVPLAALLHDGPAVADDHAGRRAWLGESMALGDPTAATFHPAGGTNLVIIGQQEDAALGMMATAVVGLALPQPAASLTIVDGNSANPPETGLLSRLTAALPGTVKLVGTRQVGEVLAGLAAEVERRQSAGTDGPPMYLAIVSLHRCRDLRRADDDFGYSRRADDAPVPPSQRLADLLREGPPVGIHVLMWCDTLVNLQRSLDRQSMRELGLRVAMQMSVADSSTYIDSPLASRLGMHRAILCSEEDGRVEKFRPYSLPPDAWLAEVKEAARALQAVPASEAGGA
jgi:DNA segregation ATPase FtsK/SpoIIIE, S-DNA-T family